MTAFIKKLLLIINIISVIAGVLFWLFCIYDALAGPASAKKLLLKLNIPLTYEQMLLSGFICLAIIFITYFFREKLSKN